MSEYKTIVANGDMNYVASPSGELLLFLPQAHHVESVAKLLNEETASLRQELASLQQANADLLAAAEVRSEELGKARGFIQGMKELVDKGNVWISPQDKLDYLAQVLAQWEAQEGESEAVE